MSVTLSKDFEPLTLEEERLVTENRGFAHQIAAEYCHPAWENFDDFIQAAYLGLMEAAKRFDPTKGLNFITYAVWWIRQKCITQAQDRVVRRPVNHFNPKMKSVEAELAQTLGRFPSDEELFDAIGVSENVGNDQTALQIPDSSMDYQVDGFSDSYGDFIAPQEPDQDKNLEQSELRRCLNQALAKLDDRERDVVLLRQEGLTLLDIGAKWGFTRERARQIEAKAYRKLKVYLRSEMDVKDFLGDHIDPYPEEREQTVNVAHAEQCEAARRAMKRFLKKEGFENG